MQIGQLHCKFAEVILRECTDVLKSSVEWRKNVQQMFKFLLEIAD